MLSDFPLVYVIAAPILGDILGNLKPVTHHLSIYGY